MLSIFFLNFLLFMFFCSSFFFCLNASTDEYKHMHLRFSVHVMVLYVLLLIVIDSLLHLNIQFFWTILTSLLFSWKTRFLWTCFLYIIYHHCSPTSFTNFFYIGFILKDFAFVNRLFVIQLGNELGPRWTISDKKGHVHHVTFNMNTYGPRITDGWVDIRKFYQVQPP